MNVANRMILLQWVVVNFLFRFFYFKLLEILYNRSIRMGSKISVAVTFYLKFILLDDVLYLLKTISEEIFLANGLVGRMCNALFQMGV